MDVVGGGRLRDAHGAPPVGEHTQVLATRRGFAVEQILSGRLDAPVEYDQDHDEWVVVLDGAAVVEVDGAERSLGRGDWLLLPAHVPHRLLRTRAGTSWLAVRGEPHDEGTDGGGRSR